MEKTKVLYVNQEVYPYVRESKEALVGRYLPQHVQESGKEIRMFTPRFGCINERRNQLHEVLRLSGFNISINEIDHPLIIKVSSIQSARMQIYFIDNEDYFHKKTLLSDRNNKLYVDTDEKLMFFARGVLEAIKKLSWIPNIVHCNGWFTSLVPLYIRKAYKDHPAFSDVKIVSTIFPGDGYKGELGGDLLAKLKIDKLPCRDFANKYGNFSYPELSKLAIDYSDGIIFGDKTAALNESVVQYAKESGKAIVNYTGEEHFMESCNKFYDKFKINNAK